MQSVNCLWWWVNYELLFGNCNVPFRRPSFTGLLLLLIYIISKNNLVLVYSTTENFIEMLFEQSLLDNVNLISRVEEGSYNHNH